jgi:prepilin-type N-terminal cleavage/methylation domain-containing protein/prepilin-type processing-associated H-X9-DG protein
MMDVQLFSKSTYQRRTPAMKGFTLVELLVVISIIAILLAIMMPALNKARGLAKRIICASHTRSMMFTTTAYVQTYGAYFPTENGYKWNNVTTGERLPADHTEAYWAVAYEKFGAQMEMFRCPGKKINFGWWNIKNAAKPDIYRKSIDYSDYAINGFICWNDPANVSMEYQGAWPWKAGIKNCKRKITDFKTPASTILLHDGFEAAMDFNRDLGDSFYIPTKSTSYNLKQQREWIKTDKAKYAGCLEEYWRHGNSAVLLWLDGHSSVLKRLGDKESVPCNWYTGGVVPEFGR